MAAWELMPPVSVDDAGGLLRRSKMLLEVCGITNISFCLKLFKASCSFRATHKVPTWESLLIPVPETSTSPPRGL